MINEHLGKFYNELRNENKRLKDENKRVRAINEALKRGEEDYKCKIVYLESQLARTRDLLKYLEYDIERYEKNCFVRWFLK